MKLLTYILVTFIATFFTISLVNAAPKPEEVFSDKYSPEKRWDMYRVLMRTDLEGCKDEKLLYFKLLYCDLLFLPRFYLMNYSKLPVTLTEYYSSNGLQLSYRDSSLYTFKPQKIVNPFTRQTTKQVDLNHLKSGEVSLFHDFCQNNVNRTLSIIWNENIDDEEIKWIRLIQENGTLLAFCQPNPGDEPKLGGINFANNGPFDIQELFPKSVNRSFLKWAILSTSSDSTTWQALNDRGNASIAGNFCGEEINNNDQEKKESIFDILNKPNIQNSALKPADRWVAVKDELLKQLKPEEQEPIVNNTTDKYFFSINTAFQHVLPSLILTNAALPNTPIDIFDKEISIDKTPIFVELPKNPYSKKTLKSTPLDKPIPGSITYLLDKTTDGQQRAMLIVWDYRIDNEEMRWLLLFEKNGGLMNFCWDTQAKDWKISPDLFKTLFTSVDNVYFYTYPPNTTSPEAK